MNGHGARAEVGPEEEEAFRQLLNEHDFDESLAMPSQLDQMAEHLHRSQLIEPMDLPKLNPVSTAYDPTLKDAFLHMMGSPMALSPSDFKVFTSTGQSPSLGHQDPHRTPRNGFYQESCFPVQALGTAPRAYPSEFEPISGASVTFQSPMWSGSPHDGVPRSMYPIGVKSASEQASSRMLVPNATGTTPRQISPLPPPVPVWLPPTLLTPTGAVQIAPDLKRNISGKKSKARKPSDSAGKATSVTTKLAISLANSSPKPKAAAAASVDAMRHSSSIDTPEKPTKGKKCIEEGCDRRAQSNSRCKSHGGGARCQYTGPGGCTRSSQGGGFCRAHGGGKRCEFPDCPRGQQRKGRCYVHGGIRKCQTEGCEKKDRGNGFCISHGGGKRCVAEGCSRSVRRGQWCQLHDDGASAS